MTAYVIMDIVVHDPDRYEEYKLLAPPAIAAYGGKYLVRGGPAENVEGKWQPNRMVVLEFESTDKAKAFINSPEYADARALRQSVATSEGIVVEGL